jgi:hypothetical protein
MADGTRSRLKTALTLLAFTVLAVMIHGYHYGIEDEAIYLPAIKKIIDPSLYPRSSEFFMGQARGTALPWIVAGIARITHGSLPWIVLLMHFVSIYVFLLGCWMIAVRSFPLARQVWAAVAMITALLTLPVAGSNIYLADQHLHPRTLACALILIATALTLDRRRFACSAACVSAALIHPLMALYGIAFVIVLWLPLERWKVWGSAPSGGPKLRSVSAISFVMLLMVAIPFIAHPTAAWREALATREYYTLRNWEWYEWLGVIAPMFIVWWLGRVAERSRLGALAVLLRRVNVYAAIMLVVTLAIALPRAADFLWPLQPARYLHTVYVLMIMSAAGLLAHNRVLAVAAATVVLAVVMCVVQFAEFGPLSGTSHIDFPSRANKNAWVEAFLWARDHTSKDAYFALDPEYMRYSDNYGFRALAERGQVADISKDAGVVTVSPQLADEWKREVDALRGFDRFTAADFARLRRDFGVDWVIVRDASFPPAGLECPFQMPSHLSVGAAVCHTPLG